MKREIPITIEGPAGVLEGLHFEQPDPRGLALICHPNPVKGGTMLNKVVSTLQRTARDAGYVTLRFNYRGVGASAGAHDMNTGEVDDAEAALNWLKAEYPGVALTLLGFSFGGFVAAALAGRLEAGGESLERLFMIAPAVSRLQGLPLADRCELTIIQPDDDERLNEIQDAVMVKDFERARQQLEATKANSSWLYEELMKHPTISAYIRELAIFGL